MNDKLDQFLAHNYFKSIDMYGGEFGTAELIREAVEELELDQVQHGITAVNSQSVMTWLCDNNIQLNICPTSNILLSRVDAYTVHPIKKLYDNGIKVTINTDDMLIFDQSVSQEFFNLYNAGLFNVTELNEIRENALSVVFNS